MQYPKGERIWTCYYSREKELLFIVTSKETSREFYYLYEVSGDKLNKLGKARNPRELEDKFGVIEKMRATKG